MNTYICDIDGTIADNSHREWVLNDKTRPRKNWDLFFNMMGDDKPIEHMRQLLWDLVKADATIVYFTGRPQAYYTLTAKWMATHLFPPGSIRMRQDGDYRADDIIKWEMYQEYIIENYAPVMIFDDRNQVVKMWRANGIPCAQMAEGDF